VADCKYCGKVIKIKFGKQSAYCSTECRLAYYTNLHRTNTTCAVCGGPLSGRNRKYCSPECKKKETSRLQYLKNREAYKSSKPKAESKAVVKKRRDKARKDLLKIVKKATEEGLTYGQYVAKYGL
jgi:predicted nucleic acid-binding Zn ribbon protein